MLRGPFYLNSKVGRYFDSCQIWNDVCTFAMQEIPHCNEKNSLMFIF
jgi:hypothetical protein